MKILIMGANGYIGRRLMPLLVEAGHDVVAFVRCHLRFNVPEEIAHKVEVIEGDLLYPLTLDVIPEDIDAAYYLIHTRSSSYSSFEAMELRCAQNFLYALRDTNCKQLIYLSELTHPITAGTHLCSSRVVEDVFHHGDIPSTVLRSSIIIGAGGAHFEILRDIVEYLPVILAPKWINARCQPIGIYDTLEYLIGVLGNEKCLNDSFEIGGPEVLTYKEMLKKVAAKRGLVRTFIHLPITAPTISSYYIYLFTHTSYSNAHALIDELLGETEVEDTRIQEILPRKCFDFDSCLERSFDKISQNEVVSHWSSTQAGGGIHGKVQDYVHVPEKGCVKDECVEYIEGEPKTAIDRVWGLGGEDGWYTFDWAWRVRGFLDKLAGGIGLRRGRTHQEYLAAGDTLDFWRVIVADKEKGHLLLYAELKMPGEAWIEWQLEEPEDRPPRLRQTATFRPKGLWGRFVWYLSLPFHRVLFGQLGRYLARGEIDD